MPFTMEATNTKPDFKAYDLLKKNDKWIDDKQMDNKWRDEETMNNNWIDN